MGIEILIFEVDSERFGIRSADVVQVLQAASFSPLPATPRIVEGALNLRGRVMPVLNIREILGLATKEMEHTDHLIVVEVDAQALTLRADRAVKLLRVEPDGMDATVQQPHSHLVEFVAKTSDGLVHVLDPRRLLADESLATVVQALEQRAATEVAQ